jgi:hypothetical protein
MCPLKVAVWLFATKNSGIEQSTARRKNVKKVTG